jgi:hypothetical protein
MPQCYRCERTLPTGELRRTKLGYVCLEGGELGKESRCLRIEKERKQAARAGRRQAA